MNDFELDVTVARVAAVSDAEVDALALSDLESDLCEAIMSTAVEPVVERAEASTGDLRRAPRWRLAPRVVGAIAAVAALIVGAFLVFQDGSSENGSAWAARAVAVAEAAPRLLVTGDGWEITEVQEFGEDFGELYFSDGHTAVELFWRPGDTHDDYVADRAGDGFTLGTLQVAGHDAQVFDLSGEFNVLWEQGDDSVELRVGGVGRQALEALLERIREVDVDTWLSAMPPSVVKPPERAATVDEMLADIPLPDGFNVDELRSVDNPGLNRYRLGGEVTGAVACSWIEQWLFATDSGDQAAVTEAVEAMTTSRDWAILQEMNAAGQYSAGAMPETIWEFADALESGQAPFGFEGSISLHDYIKDQIVDRPDADTFCDDYRPGPP
ncbi:MAG: hypothetical protein ACRDY6_08580 [Acidimicrobiia bacterium]